MMPDESNPSSPASTPEQGFSDPNSVASHPQDSALSLTQTSSEGTDGSASVAETVTARRIARPTYWLTRFVILRLLGFVYLTAFLVAAHQIVPLVGHEGILPADTFLERVAKHFGSVESGFRIYRACFGGNSRMDGLKGLHGLGWGFPPW